MRQLRATLVDLFARLLRVPVAIRESYWLTDMMESCEQDTQRQDLCGSHAMPTASPA